MQPQYLNIKFEVHLKNKHFAGGTWALVSDYLSRLASKTKRINITMPEQVLTLVDEQARREGEPVPGTAVARQFFIGCK